MKYIQAYEEIKYTPEHKKLISQLRYRLNKFFGCNCGVSKLRSIIKRRYGYSTEYETYTGSTMIFQIYLPSFINGLWDNGSNKIENYDQKIEEFKNLATSIGLEKPYGYDDYFSATEEQMKELISKMKYIEEHMIAKKYNL